MKIENDKFSLAPNNSNANNNFMPLFILVQLGTLIYFLSKIYFFTTFYGTTNLKVFCDLLSAILLQFDNLKSFTLQLVFIFGEFACEISISMFGTQQTTLWLSRIYFCCLFAKFLMKINSSLGLRLINQFFLHFINVS